LTPETQAKKLYDLLAMISGWDESDTTKGS